MTDGRDRLSGIGKVAHRFQDARVQPEILGSAAAGNRQSIVITGFDVIEGRIQGEVVAALFAVGLIASKS